MAEISRRSMIGAAGAGGVALWTAPAMMGTVRAAAAASDSPNQNLLVNPSFEEPAIADNSYALLGSIPGWQTTGTIEIQRGGISGTPHSGEQLIELDSTASSDLFQTVSTNAGTQYLLTVWFSPRPGTDAADNVLEIKWEGVVIDTISADGTGLPDTVWIEHTYVVTATGASSTVTLTDLGTSNSLGTYIDDVTLVEI